jgi:hypothetical protein
MKDQEKLLLMRQLEATQAYLLCLWKQYTKGDASSGRRRDAQDFYSFIKAQTADSLNKLQDYYAPQETPHN